MRLAVVVRNDVMHALDHLARENCSKTAKARALAGKLVRSLVFITDDGYDGSVVPYGNASLTCALHQGVVSS